MSEEKQAVVVVTEAGGREVRYRADKADTYDGVLQVVQHDSEHGGTVVAQYAPGYYQRAYREDAMLGDVGKLPIALKALREIAEDEDTNSKAHFIATSALDDIASLDDGPFYIEVDTSPPHPPLTVTPAGYQGPAQHTYTSTCDGFHEPGQCTRIEARGVDL